MRSLEPSVAVEVIVGSVQFAGQGTVIDVGQGWAASPLETAAWEGKSDYKGCVCTACPKTGTLSSLEDEMGVSLW